MRVIIATSNPNKVAEVTEALKPTGMTFRTMADIPEVPDSPEDSATFVGNALQKANWVLGRIPDDPIVVVADDSGVCVARLNGSPGIHSRRWSASCDDGDNNNKLLREMREHTDRRAHYVTALAVLVRTGGVVRRGVIRVRVPGKVLHAPAGSGGFGYDPLIQLDSSGKTMAQLSPAEKTRHSARGHAFMALHDMLRTLKGASVDPGEGAVVVDAEGALLALSDVGATPLYGVHLTSQLHPVGTVVNPDKDEPVTLVHHVILMDNPGAYE